MNSLKLGPYGRSPLLAALLSLPAPGLGHLYAGQAGKGIALAVATLCVASSRFLICAGRGASASLLGLLLPIGAFLTLSAYAVFSAARLAALRRGSFALRGYNRLPAYAVFLLLSVAGPLLIASEFRRSVLQVFKMAGSSMAPTLRDGDRILVRKSPGWSRSIERGDVVVFRPPSDPDRHWIQRVIGLPGDEIEIRTGKVFMNGKAVISRDMLLNSTFRLFWFIDVLSVNVIVGKNLALPSAVLNVVLIILFPLLDDVNM